MKKLLLLCTAAAVCAALFSACSSEQPTGVASTDAATPAPTPLGNSYAGNGFPSGAHYNLNIIGVPEDKTADMTGNNGHRIFVSLEGRSKIMLQEGDDFQVLDANATDDPAVFQLPNPDPENDGVTEYSVFARALGSPGGATMTTCAEDSAGVTWCSTISEVFVRESKKPMARNVSRALLYIYADLDGNGQDERYPLFDDALEGYYWRYDNDGLRLLQLRFYEIATDVN